MLQLHTSPSQLPRMHLCLRLSREMSAMNFSCRVLLFCVIWKEDFFFDVDCRVALKNKTTVYEVHRVFYALWVCHPIFVTYDPKEIGVMVEKVKF